MSGLSGAPRMAPKQRSTRPSRPKAVVQPVLDIVGLRAAIDAPPVDLSLQPGATLTFSATSLRPCRAFWTYWQDSCPIWAAPSWSMATM